MVAILSWGSLGIESDVGVSVGPGVFIATVLNAWEKVEDSRTFSQMLKTLLEAVFFIVAETPVSLHWAHFSVDFYRCAGLSF